MHWQCTVKISEFYSVALRLRRHVDHAAHEAFVREDQRRMLVVESDPLALLDRFASYAPPALPKWLGPGKT